MIVESFSVSREVVVDGVERLLQGLIRVVERVFCGRFGNLKVALGAIIISLVTNFPVYHQFKSMVFHDREDWAIFLKSQHPLAPLPATLVDRDSHLNKIELRLTLPILGHLSGTGMWTIVIWNHLSAFGVFYLLSVLARKALDDETAGALFVLGLGATSFANGFFSDIEYGDGVAFFFLILAIASGSVLLTCGSSLAAAFCDERAVTAVPLLLVYLALRYNSDQERGLRRRLITAVLTGVGAWFVLRAWIENTFHLSMGHTDLATLAIFQYQVTEALPYVFLSIFKASWLLPFFAILSLLLLRRWRLLFVVAGAFVFAVAPAFLVWDFDRSVFYTFVILLISLYFVRGDTNTPRKYLAAILFVNILLVSPRMTILRIPLRAWRYSVSSHAAIKPS
jgi:hypothetical protein